MTTIDPHMPFVPEGYLGRSCAGFDLWYHEEEPAEGLTMLEEVMSSALAWVVDELGFEPKRSLHLCMYASNEEAVRSLARNVPANMAMAPFASEEASLIIVQSPRAHAKNADADRMRRVLVHEICQVLVRERTGSTQILGDGMRGLRVRPWLDEGFAEAMSRRACGLAPLTPDSPRKAWDADELDRELCDLRSGKREAAFGVVTQLFESLLAQRGARAVFRELPAQSSQRRDSGVGYPKIAWAALVVLAFGMCIVLSVQAVQGVADLRSSQPDSSPWNTAVAFAPTLVVILGVWVWFVLRSKARFAGLVRAVILMSPAVVFEALVHGIRAMCGQGYPYDEVCMAIPASLVALLVYGVVLWRQTAPADRLFLVLANLIAIASCVPAATVE